MIYVIDDDEIMQECIERACGEGVVVKKYTNAIDAMAEIEATGMPELIFLDIMLTGPDGFTLLHELTSYDDTAKIPIVVVSSLELGAHNLSEYGVVGVLSKETMKPKDIKDYVRRYCK